MSHLVFISHSSKDSDCAKQICESLEEHDVKCWVSYRDNEPGKGFAGRIVGAIASSRLFILILSKTADQSEHIISEVNRAFNRTPILVVKIEDFDHSDDMDYYLSHKHWLFGDKPASPPLNKKQLEQINRTVIELLGISDERRQMERYAVGTCARISFSDISGNENGFLALIKNLSGGGAYLVPNVKLDEEYLVKGADVRMCFVLSFEELETMKARRIEFEIAGKIVRVEETGFAVCFDDSSICISRLEG